MRSRCVWCNGFNLAEGGEGEDRKSVLIECDGQSGAAHA